MIAIGIEGLGKSYRIPHIVPDGGRRSFQQRVTDVAGRLFGRNNRETSEEFWALSDVTFDVHQGQAVGIIGRNGSGKSTLLKVLSRVTEPTRGSAVIHGRIGSLLEVGTGFHPDLTGRENVFLNGAILGMRRAEILRKFDEIIAFAEVERFIDTPVKHYSSGMYMRLAFAVAAHLEPEILIIDEVLAVGDLAFQRKSLNKMNEVAREGRTVLFVSHNMAAIENLCQRAVLLSAGKLIEQGETHDVISAYLRMMRPPDIDRLALIDRTDRSGSGALKLSGFRLEDTAGRAIASARSGMDVCFVLDYMSFGASLRNVDVGVSIVGAESGAVLFVLYSSFVGQLFDEIPPFGTLRCWIDDLPLFAGRYRVEVRITVNGEEADWVHNGVGEIEVETGDFFGAGSPGWGPAAPILVRGTFDVST